MNKKEISNIKVGDIIKDKLFSQTYKVIEFIDNGIKYATNDEYGEIFTKNYDEDDWDSYEIVKKKNNSIKKLKSLSDGKFHLGWLNDAEVVENFIKKLWHDGSQKPNTDKKIFVIDIYDDYYVGYPGGINPKCIKKWMYVNEMLLTLCYENV